MEGGWGGIRKECRGGGRSPEDKPWEGAGPAEASKSERSPQDFPGCAGSTRCRGTWVTGGEE